MSKAKTKKLQVSPEQAKPICGLATRSMIVKTSIELGVSLLFNLDGSNDFAKAVVTRKRPVIITENSFKIVPEIKGAKPYKAGNLDAVAEINGFKDWAEMRRWLQKNLNLKSDKPLEAFWIDFDKVQMTKSEEELKETVASFTVAKKATKATGKGGKKATPAPKANQIKEGGNAQ